MQCKRNGAEQSAMQIAEHGTEESEPSSTRSLFLRVAVGLRSWAWLAFEQCATTQYYKILSP